MPDHPTLMSSSIHNSFFYLLIAVLFVIFLTKVKKGVAMKFAKKLSRDKSVENDVFLRFTQNVQKICFSFYFTIYYNNNTPITSTAI